MEWFHWKGDEDTTVRDNRGGYDEWEFLAERSEARNIPRSYEQFGNMTARETEDAGSS